MSRTTPIREQEKLKISLRESLEKFRSYIDNAPDGVFVADENGRYVEVNRVACEITGYSEAELLTMSIPSVIAPESIEEGTAHFATLISTGSAKGEFLYLHRDGSHRWWSVDAVKLSNTRYLGFVKDITERKTIEAAQQFLLQCGYRNPDENFFESLARYLGETLGIYYVCIDRLLGDHLTAQTVAVYCDGKFEDNLEYALKDTPCGILVGQTICSFPRNVCALFPHDPALKELDSESYIGSTLWGFDGKPIGLIALIDRKPMEKTAMAESLLKLVSVRAAGELERRQALTVLQQRAETQRVLSEIAQATLMSSSMEDFYRTVHHLISVVLPAKLFHINLLDEATNEIVVPFSADNENVIPRRRPLDKGMTEYIMRLGRAVLVTPAEMDRLSESGEYTLGKVQNVKIRQYLGAPLIDSQGKPFGVMSLILMGERQSFQPEDVEVISIIASQVSLAIERKHAETELRESEERFKALHNASFGGICIHDRGIILDSNEGLSGLTGFSKEQLVGMNGLDLIAPLWRELVMRNILSGYDQSYEVEGLRKDGGKYHLRIQGKDIPFQGRTVRVTEFRDITEAKMAEAAIQSSQARYHALMEQSSEALALVDILTQEVVEINRRFTELFGYSLPEDAPLFVKKFVVDSQHNLDEFYNVILKKQGVLPPEIRLFRHKNGVEVPVERAGTVIGIDGRDYNLASMRDMTAERRRQAELTRDVEFARRVQEGLLPVLSPSPFVDVRTLYYPAHFVSGDSYHLEWHNDGKLMRGFLVDVSGHGLATAIQTSSINVLLREIANSKLPLLAQVQWVNKRVAKYFTDDAYAAMLGFELDLSLGELRYVGAGITQFFVNGNKQETPGMFVGLWEDAEFKEGTIALAEGDSFCFLSDGFTDALAQMKNAAFWSSGGTDFEADVSSLKELGEKGNLRDDATGICLNIKALH